jgi:predicted Zn-dependent protease
VEGLAADGGRLARAVPAEWERSIGAAAAAAVIGGKRVCGAPEGQAALDALLARLAAAGGVAGPVRARVLDEPAVNALAAPGGEILVYRGLLDRAESPTNWRASWRTRSATWSTATALRGMARAAGLFVLSGALSGGSDAVALATVLVGLSYSRDFEREADASAARILASAGIGTGGPGGVLRAHGAAVVGAVEPRLGLLTTHPADGDRAAALRGAAGRPAAAPAPALSAAEWAAVRSMCGS